MPRAYGNSVGRLRTIYARIALMCRTFLYRSGCHGATNRRGPHRRQHDRNREWAQSRRRVHGSERHWLKERADAPNAVCDGGGDIETRAHLPRCRTGAAPHDDGSGVRRLGTGRVWVAVMPLISRQVVRGGERTNVRIPMPRRPG